MPRITLDKLRRYVIMKMDQARKRLMYVRKPYVIATHPRRWLSRRRSGAASALTTDARSTLGSLQECGFAPATRLTDRSLVDEVQRIVDNRLSEGKNGQAVGVSARKNFWNPILMPVDLNSQSPLVRLALTPEIVETVTAYLGHVPHLSRLELIVSRPVAGQDWRLSQLWHRDFNDSRMVKLFVYFSDVESESSGPFTFMPANALRAGMGPMFPIHKNDEAMERIAPLESQRQVLGLRGTAFFIDTHRCFHCGSRILDGRHRVAYIATYTTCAPYYEYDNKIVVSPDESASIRNILHPV